MKGAPGGSWRDFGHVAGGGRSAAWAHLISPSSPSKSSQGLCRTAAAVTSVSPTSFEMFLDALSATKSSSGNSFNGSSLNASFGQRRGMDGTTGVGYNTGYNNNNTGSVSGGGSDWYKRAALDFVMELAGPQTVLEKEKEKFLCPNTFICAEELPVAMFAVDKDMQCTMWNRRLVELSGWSEGEALAGQRFASGIFFPVQGTYMQKTCEDNLKAVFFGVDVSGVEYLMRAKNGSSICIMLYANTRTDALGVANGVLCVVMKQTEASPTTTPPVPLQRSRLEISEDGGDQSSGSSDGISIAGTSEPCTPSTPSRVTSASQGLEEGPGLCNYFFESQYASESKDVFQRSVSTPETSNMAVVNGNYSSSKVLVVDGLSANRSLLASQLERCGLEVVCASSSREATWRFEQSLVQNGGRSPYALIFVELQAASKDGYAAIREIRRLEKSNQPSDGCPSNLMIVAVTNMNRWDLAGMDNSMDKGMNAGVDSIIPQNIKMQQLRSTLRKLGVRSKYLDVPTTLPRALSGLWHNPLNLSR